jgi:predicted  nucleic acid-binding Zn-ribbon protein
MHQCLQCGKVFVRSSKSLLKGCPDCGGTKFFYTKEPLREEDRKKILEEANRDLHGFVEGVVRGGGIFSDKEKTSFVVDDLGRGKFIELVYEARGAFAEGKEREVGRREAKIEEVGEGIQIPEERGIKEKPKKDEDLIKSLPGVIDVERSGVYRINVDSLMKDRAIVIRREESYFIHLPSAFERSRRS